MKTSALQTIRRALVLLRYIFDSRFYASTKFSFKYAMMSSDS